MTGFTSDRERDRILEKDVDDLTFEERAKLFEAASELDIGEAFTAYTRDLAKSTRAAIEDQEP